MQQQLDQHQLDRLATDYQNVRSTQGNKRLKVVLDDYLLNPSPIKGRLLLQSVLNEIQIELGFIKILLDDPRISHEYLGFHGLYTFYLSHDEALSKMVCQAICNHERVSLFELAKDFISHIDPTEPEELSFLILFLSSPRLKPDEALIFRTWAMLFFLPDHIELIKKMYPMTKNELIDTIKTSILRYVHEPKLLNEAFSHVFRAVFKNNNPELDLIKEIKEIAFRFKLLLDPSAEKMYYFFANKDQNPGGLYPELWNHIVNTGIYSTILPKKMS